VKEIIGMNKYKYTQQI